VALAAPVQATRGPRNTTRCAFEATFVQSAQRQLSRKSLASLRYSCRPIMVLAMNYSYLWGQHQLAGWTGFGASMPLRDPSSSHGPAVVRPVRQGAGGA
jgi:hypothetical protein